MKWPMKLCLTFDDGLKTHSEIAAPLLQKYGFKGAFNVPTEFMDSDRRKLTKSQIHDCRIDGNEDNLMDWNDVRCLLKEGHEVYPHTLGHIDLLDLERRGAVEELKRQVEESKQQFIEHCGFAPMFFCSPHNSKSSLIVDVIHANGMELFSCWRRNFPSHPSRNPPRIPVAKYLLEEFYKGAAVVDVMVHGIDASRGGWEPFADDAAFEAFLHEIQRLVCDGIVEVVPYSHAHRSFSILARPIHLYDRILNKVRRGLLKFGRIK